MTDQEMRDTLRVAMDAFPAHEADHSDVIDVDCPFCRAEAIALGMASALPPARCPLHPAYEPDYCPLCGTAQVIGGTK